MITVTICSDFGAQENKVCHYFHCFSSICHEVMGLVVWYSHLFQIFPQFIVSHTVKGFGIVNKAEVDVFLELLLFR